MLSKTNILRLLVTFIVIFIFTILPLNVFAAVPTGKASVNIEPATGSYYVADVFQSRIYFDTANTAISGIAVRLTYPYSGISPEIKVNSVAVNPAIANSPEWTCPTKGSYQENSNVVIDIACANTSGAGYLSTGKIELATINFEVIKIPVRNPLIVRFDPSYSIITQKPDGRDILMIPVSTGTYTINEVVSPTVTQSPSITPTPTIVPTVTVVPSLNPTPTIKPISYPAISPAIKFKKPVIFYNWLENICRNLPKKRESHTKSLTNFYRNLLCPSTIN